MPYASGAQQRFFHANVGKNGLTAKVVKEFDQATTFKGLPERKNKMPAPDMAKHPSSHRFKGKYNDPQICAVCGMRKSSHPTPE